MISLSAVIAGCYLTQIKMTEIIWAPHAYPYRFTPRIDPVYESDLLRPMVGRANGLI